MHSPAFVLLALAAGALLAAQGPIFTRLAFYAGGPLQAATFAFVTALAALLALSYLSGAGLPKAAGIKEMPLWVWAGSLIGTVIIVMTIQTIPRIGVAAFAAAAVCGQLIAALVYDHIGAFGMEPRQIGLREIAGVIFLLAGVVMIAGHHRP